MTRNADGTYGYGNEDARRRKANDALIRYLGNIQKTKTNQKFVNQILSSDDTYENTTKDLNHQYSRRQYMGLSNG